MNLSSPMMKYRPHIRLFTSAACLLAVLAVTGCQSVTAEQRAWLDSGKAAYQSDNYDRALSDLTRFINAVPDQPETSEAQYIRALSLLKLGRRLDARTEFARCAETAADRDVRWRAYTTLGTIDYEDHQWTNAARSYAAALEIAPPADAVPIVLFRLGVCYERIGRWSDAPPAYQRIVDEFPQSSVAEAARRRLELRASHFAVQCGVFSSESNAMNETQRLRAEGLQAYARPELRSGVRVYVVLVGKYSRYEDAITDLGRVKGYVESAVLWP